MLSVTNKPCKLNAVMLSAVMLSAVVVNVIAPLLAPYIVRTLLSLPDICEHTLSGAHLMTYFRLEHNFLMVTNALAYFRKVRIAAENIF